jgi:hypothetical protein
MKQAQCGIMPELNVVCGQKLVMERAGKCMYWNAGSAYNAALPVYRSALWPIASHCSDSSLLVYFLTMANHGDIDEIVQVKRSFAGVFFSML